MKRLDAEVFPSPEVAEAMRPFVPVKVDAEDGEGRPLVERYSASHHAGISGDPVPRPGGSRRPKDARIVGKIPGFMPAASFVEQLNTIARLPRDVGPLMKKAHPDDGDAMRQLATALAMQGRIKEAAALIDRAWGPGAGPGLRSLGRGLQHARRRAACCDLKLGEAAEWFNKAARVAKRPIDVYNARLGAGFVAMFQGEGGRASRELEAAARVDGVSSVERDFAKELLGRVAKPAGGRGRRAGGGRRVKTIESGKRDAFWRQVVFRGERLVLQAEIRPWGTYLALFVRRGPAWSCPGIRTVSSGIGRPSGRAGGSAGWSGRVW